MSEFMVGDDGVLSWSPPVPPNGVILHYNVIITRADTGELVRRVDVFEDQSIDLTAYGGEIGMDYNVTVTNIMFAIMYTYTDGAFFYTVCV